MKRQIPDDLSKVETSDLLQWYANAKSTSSCGGHYKGKMNDSFYLNYALELRKRKIFVYKDLTEFFNKEFTPNVQIPDGIFNGEGSF